jgi:hypothetical protein
MPDIAIKNSLPGWLNYVLTFTGITGLTGVVLLYLYQCSLIYPASYPEGSRQQVHKKSNNILIYQTNYNEKGGKTFRFWLTVYRRDFGDKG